MFARRLTFYIEGPRGRSLVPKAWLDRFLMRNFTGYRTLDETLPVADGVVEAGFRVPPQEAASRLEGWLRGQKLLAHDENVRVECTPPESARRS
jgi:hypothetical protein